MRPAFRKLLILGLPAAVVATVFAMAAVEMWVRVQWDDRQGTPGFYITDASLGTRLSPGYDGWFAGVPVRINSLGFRDNREYRLEKAPGTFRILVLGDSVTFGHGASFETTYPYLLEMRLQSWRPDVQWEVWNLGVPGYNTAQELAQLLELGERFAPDLVVVGFYLNDFTANDRIVAPTVWTRTRGRLLSLMQRHLYSYEFYKRVYLTARWRLFTNPSDRQLLESLSGEARLLHRQDPSAAAAELQLTDVEYFDDAAIASFVCDPNAGPPDPNRDRLRTRIEQGAPEITAWRASVEALQKLHAEGRYRIAFFVNMAPQACPHADRFYDGGSFEDDELLRQLLGKGTPVVSSTLAFLHYRPSQMPGASGHAIGNANRVKADTLFTFLKANVLPPLLPPAP
jgi:hypothetical protein